MKSNVYKDYLKNYFEPLLKILFCIIVILVVRLSGLEDLSFILSKKSANATVLEIIKREGIRKPYQVRVNYYNGENNIEDFIYVDKSFLESIYLGKSEDVFYSNFIWRNTYFVNYNYPGIFIVICQFLIYCAVGLVAYQEIKTLKWSIWLKHFV